MKTYTIHLIRHGITIANTNGIYAGITDYPLSKEGIYYLNELKGKYQYPKAEILYTSPLKRCTETCEILYPE